MADASSKLVWNPDNVRDVAESVGISSLNDEAVRALSQEVEYRVGQVIVEAMRFMHQGKRTVLGTQDVAQALKVLDVEPLYGYESTRPLRFGEASLGPGQPLFYIEDEEMDFEKLINAPLPKVPRDMSFTAHWLAVEGVQPSIPQNPTTAEARTTELLPKGPGANQSVTAMAGNDGVTFKPQVKHVISKELQLFFDKIKNALLDEDADEEVVRLREAAFASVRSEPGLHQLVPYFVQFVAEKVTHQVKNTFVLRQMMELTAALISNPSLYIDPYANTLCAPVLTCLIGNKLGSSDSHDELQAQYQLRELSASLIGTIAKKFAKSSHQLRPRLARTFLTYFLEPRKSLPAHYGAISGLSAIGGPEGVRQLIIPNLKAFDIVLQKGQNEGGEGNLDVEMVIGAILKAIGSLVDESGGIVVDGGGWESHEAELIEKLGPIVGARVEASGDSRLVKAVLEVKV